ncbi:hypothetical protein LJK87_26080 [Paenibacillus sp. P25]|nr:hypothetical protein LJK87_26080 [Paenibacillus sp. P25]
MGIYLILLFGGYARSWQDRLERSALPALVRFPVYVLWLQLTVFLAFLPLRIAGYALSRHYGISTQSVPGWLRDKAVGFGVNYVMMLAAPWWRCGSSAGAGVGGSSCGRSPFRSPYL